MKGEQMDLIKTEISPKPPKIDLEGFLVAAYLERGKEWFYWKVFPELFLTREMANDFADDLPHRWRNRTILEIIR